MPINSIQRQGGGMPKIGQLRKGAIKATNAPGRNLSYFRFVSNFPEVVQAFEAEYGKEPARLEAIIPAQLNEAWDYWMECWKGGGLVRRCDQNSIVLKLVDGRYQVGQFPCWCAANPNAKKEDLCNEAGRLKLFLPKLGRWGYVELVTGAWWDITEITRCLQDIENRAGTLIGMPIILERVQKEVSHATPEGKRTRNKQWVIHVEAHPSFAAERLLAWEARIALPAGGDAPDDDNEGEDIIPGEFVDETTGEIVTEGQGDRPGEPDPEPPAVRVQDMPQWIEFHKLGGWLYANRWNTFRPKVVAVITSQRASSSKDLTPDELQKAVNLMGKKIGKLAESQNAMTAHLVELSGGTVSVKDASEFIDVILVQSGKDYQVVPLVTAFCHLLDNDDIEAAVQAYETAVGAING